MQARIFILEDNIIRIAKFRKVLPRLFPAAEITVAIEADEAKDILVDGSYWDIILLDHDLGGRVYVDSADPNTGYQVALHIRDNNVKYGQCITHTQNPVGGKNIVNVLGCEFIPFPQLEKFLNAQKTL
jgi:hypothetical protein